MRISTSNRPQSTAVGAAPRLTPDERAAGAASISITVTPGLAIAPGLFIFIGDYFHDRRDYAPMRPLR
jgi:hypothetical protein